MPISQILDSAQGEAWLQQRSEKQWDNKINATPADMDSGHRASRKQSAVGVQTWFDCVHQGFASKSQRGPK